MRRSHCRWIRFAPPPLSAAAFAPFFGCPYFGNSVRCVVNDIVVDRYIADIKSNWEAIKVKEGK
ncbi:MAG: hypothetical protein ACPGYL_01070, partial [Rhodospirillaceae bacterium]